VPKCMLSTHSYARPPKISSFYDIFFLVLQTVEKSGALIFLSSLH